MWILRFFLVFLMVWMVWGCEQTAYIPATKTIYLDVPVGFPEPIIPDNNQLSEARIALGKKLFFEPALSLDSSISCASCHKQELAFADDRPVSPGIKGRLGFR
ncbi:MAG: cytochrome-c peroxidase, partial [Saprospiraceae bacterium]|nr:cytochrome-c peroxidase [Saprospiraceae bacterium]